MGPAWEPCGPDMGTGSARPRRAALSERAVSSMDVGRLGSSKYLVQWRQSIACTRFALGLPILPESGQRGTSRLADDRGSAAQNLTVYSGTDGNAATVAKTGPPWEPRGFGVLQEIIIRALSMPVDSGPDLPDAAGVRARLLHSCVLVVSSRRDFTFPTAKFGLSTTWNLEHLLRSWTAAILAVFPERRSSCPYSHSRLSTAPDPGLSPLSSLSSSTTKPQATWAPRSISISFSTSTSDSRLSTSVIPFPREPASFFDQSRHHRPDRFPDDRRVCFFDAEKATEPLTRVQWRPSRSSPSTLPLERHPDGSVIRPSRVFLLGR